MQLQINFLSSSPAIRPTRLDPCSQNSYSEVSKNPKYHGPSAQLCLQNWGPKTGTLLFWGRNSFKNL